MPKPKANIEIGRRAYLETLRLFHSNKSCILALGCGKHTVYEWGNGGSSPGAHFLARLYYCGADIPYILTGRKTKQMSAIPDHPVIRAMERDGQLPDTPGWVCRCSACQGAIYPGEKIYRVNDKVFCDDHGEQALEEVSDRA